MFVKKRCKGLNYLTVTQNVKINGKGFYHLMGDREAKGQTIM